MYNFQIFSNEDPKLKKYFFFQLFCCRRRETDKREIELMSSIPKDLADLWQLWDAHLRGTWKHFYVFYPDLYNFELGLEHSLWSFISSLNKIIFSSGFGGIRCGLIWLKFSYLLDFSIESRRELFYDKEWRSLRT